MNNCKYNLVALFENISAKNYNFRKPFEKISKIYNNLNEL